MLATLVPWFPQPTFYSRMASLRNIPLIGKRFGAGLVCDLSKKYDLPLPYIRIFKILGLGLEHLKKR